MSRKLGENKVVKLLKFLKLNRNLIMERRTNFKDLPPPHGTHINDEAALRQTIWNGME